MPKRIIKGATPTSAEQASYSISQLGAHIDEAIKIDMDAYPYAVMLLGQARDMADDLIADLQRPDYLDGQEFIDDVFHIEANVLGARALEETPFSVKLLCTSVLQGCCELRGGDPTGPSGIPPMARNSGALPVAAGGAPAGPGADLSPEQVRSVLETIATTANVMRVFAHNAGQDPSGEDVYIMATMAERIGQLADFAGAGCVGGPAEWMLGPNFKDEGVSHV